MFQSQPEAPLFIAGQHGVFAFRDGSVEGVLVSQSSGYPVLDAAAIRIVHLAEPFPPLPKGKDDIDILDVVRTWEFKNGSVDSD